MKKRILSVAVASLLVIMIFTSAICVSASGSEMPFSDVKEGQWYYDAVRYVYDNELMNGVGSDKFSPTGPMTRAMFVTVLGRLDGVGTDSYEKDGFRDTNKNTWYSPYISWASDNGIVNGYPDGTFLPDKALTREEMSAIISRYIEYTGVIMTWDPDSPRGFTDQSKIGSWAADYVSTLSSQGIVAGMADGSFAPKKKLNRAESATILMRINEKMKELTEENPFIPDIFTEDGNSVIMGPYDIYYAFLGGAGHADDSVTAENGITVLKHTSDENTVRRWMNMTERYIDTEVFPYVRISVITDGNAPEAFFLCEGGEEYTSGALSSGTDSYGKWAVFDIKDSSGGPGQYNSGSSYKYTGYEVSGCTYADVAYVAFFRTSADAEAFDYSGYADPKSEYTGPGLSYVSGTQDNVKDYIAEKNRMISQIVSSESSLTPEYVESLGGTCYYISSVRGDDSNDGLTPDTPWKSLSTLVEIKAGGSIIIPRKGLKEGDGFFFERGSVFDASDARLTFKYSGDSLINCINGCYYGAYGTGSKPVFSLAVDYYGKTKWLPTEYDNIWRLDFDFELPSTAEQTLYYDVGNIVLTDSEGNTGYGIKIMVDNPSGEEGYLGEGRKTVGLLKPVTDGFGHVINVEPRSAENIGTALVNNLEFLHAAYADRRTSDLYMYFDKGNPSDLFEKIIVCQRGSIFNASNNSIIDNLSFEYGGVFAISGSELENILVENCVMSWMGGSIQGGTTRYGNSFQNWSDCNGICLRNNYITQSYDAAVTTQGNGRMMNFTVQDNVIEYAVMPIELFNYERTSEGICANYIFTGNYIDYTGYGFCSTRRDREYRSPYFSWVIDSDRWTNVRFTDNVCLYSAMFGCFSGAYLSRGDTRTGPYFADNVYVTDKTTVKYALLWDGMGFTPNGKTFVPHSARGAGYLQNMGVDIGSKYIYVDDYIFECEDKDVYSDIGNYQ